MEFEKKTVTHGGIEFEVLTDAEMLRQRTAPVKPIQLCVRVAEDPDAAPISAAHARRREQHPCEDCGQPCWFDPKAGPGRLFVTLLCIQCMSIRALS